ncbi:MAG: hypothetical protein ACM3SM_06955 [Bacteroidota bacterium]
MFGKATLLLILGFTITFMVVGYNFSGVTLRSVDNMSRYYEETTAHNIAVSGANVASSQIFFNKSWTPGSAYDNIDYMGGKLKVTLKDTLTDKKVLRSVGTFAGVHKAITILLQPSNFAKFGNFYNVFSAAAATGDTFSGPFHANDYCSVHGNPVFTGKTTCLKGLKKNFNPSNPKFLGGFESGVQIPLEFDTTGMRSNAFTGGTIFKGTSSKPYVDANFIFNADGTVTYKTRLGTSSTTWGTWSASQTVALNALTPNGLIYIEKGNATVQGTLNGKATIVATKKGATGVGNVYIPDDIVYHSNPLTNPASTDMLGIVAEQKVEITYNNSRGDINIHASIYAQKDGLSIENISSYSTIHNMRILGGVIAYQTKGTAEYQGANPVRGYRFVHKFDERFLLNVPPYFPKTRFYEIISWLE